jgi:hypothetical protein
MRRRERRDMRRILADFEARHASCIKPMHRLVITTQLTVRSRTALDNQSRSSQRISDNG